MKSKVLFSAIGNIDDKFIDEDAEGIITIKESKRVRTSILKPWMKVAMPAAACLIIALTFILGQNDSLVPPINNDDSNLSANNQFNGYPSAQLTPSEDTTPSNGSRDQLAHNFLMDGKFFSPISFLERKRFGIVDQNADGLTNENTYVITENDLGDVIGFIESSMDASLIGATVYHFSAFPETYSIVIVKTTPYPTEESQRQEMVQGNEINGSFYAFYTFAGYDYSLLGASSDEILDTYGMIVENVSRISVFGQNHITPISIITDSEQITVIIELLRGNADIGFETHEELVLSWLEVHESDSAYRADLFDNAGRRTIVITTTNEIELMFFYFPFINTFFVGDSYFVLTEESVTALNAILLDK